MQLLQTAGSAVLLCGMAILFLQSPITMGKANALSIKNCSGSPIRIETNKPDNSHRSAKVSTFMGLGSNQDFQTSSALVAVKVFENSIVKTLRISIPGLDSGGTYSAIRIPNGQWQLVRGHAC